MQSRSPHGRLLQACGVKTVPSSLVPFLEGLCSALLHPDPGLRASLFYLWHVLLGGASPAAMAPALAPPPALRDRLCSALPQSLADACTPELTLNCLGESAARGPSSLKLGAIAYSQGPVISKARGHHRELGARLF